MCVSNPVEFHSDTPIIAYKVMAMSYTVEGAIRVQSQIAGNIYFLGRKYCAGDPIWTRVSFSDDYDQGFHAYERLEDAEKLCYHYVVVKVELSDLMLKGEETAIRDGIDEIKIPVYVANKCKFIEIVTKEY